MKVKKISKADQSVSYRVYQSDGLPHDVINGFLRNRDHRGYAPLTIKSHAVDLKDYMSQKLIEEYDIRDENGELLAFTSHMLRHTVASNLVESGVNQVFVQKFLGHKTPTMTNFYAQISEKKMRLELKFDDVDPQELKDIYGNIYKHVDYDLDEKLDGDLDKEWLRKNISAHILPNGICSLPIRQTCHHGNACLTCVSFRTGKQFKDKLEDQRERLIKIINIADEGGLRDQVMINTKTLEGLDKILENIDE